MKVKGFTLIELIVVIVILGILAVTAAPKFLDISNDAKASVVIATGAAFESSVDLVANKVKANGGGPLSNFQFYGTTQAGQLDINQWGYPAQNWFRDEDFPRLDNDDDCMSLWNTILQEPPTVSESDDVADSEYQAIYISTDQCRFIFNEIPQMSIYYDSRNGNVVVDSDYSN